MDYSVHVKNMDELNPVLMENFNMDYLDIIGMMDKRLSRTSVQDLVDVLYEKINLEKLKKDFHEPSRDEYIVFDLHKTLDYGCVDLKGKTVNRKAIKILVDRICSISKTKYKSLVLSYVGKVHLPDALFICVWMLENGLISEFGLCSKRSPNLSFGTKGHFISKIGKVVACFDDNVSNGISFNLAVPNSFLLISDEKTDPESRFHNTTKKMIEFITLKQ